MATNSRKYTLQFEANARGLDEIVKKIAAITKSGNFNLTESMTKDLNKLQNSMHVFMKTLSAELQKENPSSEMLRELYSQFNNINGMAQKFGLTLSSLVVPEQLQKDLEAVTEKLKDQQREAKNLQNQIRNAQKKIGDDGQLTDARKAANFSKAGGTKLDSGSDVPFANAGDLKARIDSLNKVNATLDQNSEQYQKNAKEIEELNAVLTKYNILCAKELENTQQAIQKKQTELTTRRNDINTTKEEIKLLKEKISLESGVTQSAQETIGLVEQLGELRSNQADALQEEKDALEQDRRAQVAQAQAEKQAQKVAQEQQKTYEKSVSTIDGATKATEENSIALDHNTSMVGRAAKQVITYGTVVRLLKTIYRETINTITQMDEALTGMAVVTSMNRDQTWELVDSLQDLANTTGTTTTEIASTMTKFLQQGKSVSQALQLTEAAAKAATIAGIDNARSVDLLTNAMNGFQLSASSAMEVSDKFAALAAASATDYEELAVALSKVAAQANLAGMSMDFTLGMLAKGIETTREAPETIGTALKTVISRMRELTDYDVTLEDGTDVNRVEKALNNVNVALRDENGEFRDLEDVLTELGGKWDTLNKNQQANVAVALAGTRQQSRLIAMMQDFDRTLELVDVSANSYGATMAQSAKYMEGLEAHLTLLTNAWQEFTTKLVKSDFVISIIDTLTNAVGIMNDIVSNGTAMTAILITIAAIGSGILINKIQQWKFSYAQYKVNVESEKLQRKQNVQEAIQLVNQKKLVKSQAEENALTWKGLEADQRRTVEALQQAKITAKNRGDMAEVARLSAELTKEEAELKVAQEESKEAEFRYQVALNNEEQAQLSLQKAQLAETSNQYEALSGLTGPMSTILGLWTSISAILSVVKVKQQINNALVDENTKKQKKNVAQIVVGALAQAAQSVAANLGWGWTIALALLAVAGIAAGVTAATQGSGDKAQSSLEKTEDSLNQLQADLYNLNNSITTITNIGDEFESLSNKIVKNNEDLERMSELVQQINDEAGETVVDVNADAETQLSQIRKYQLDKENERAYKLKESSDEISEGFKDYAHGKAKDKAYSNIWGRMGTAFATGATGVGAAGAMSMGPLGAIVGGTVGGLTAAGITAIGSMVEASKLTDAYAKSIETKKEYLESLGEAGEATLRSLAQDSITNLTDYSSETQDILKDLFVDAGAYMLTDEGTFDTSVFKDLGFDDEFAQDLDKAITDGSLTAYYDFVDSLENKTEGLQQKFLESNSVFAGIYKIGADNVKQLEKVGASIDDINVLWGVSTKLAKTSGKDTSTIFSNIIAKQAELTEKGMDSNHAMYVASVEAVEAAAVDAQEKISQVNADASDDELEQMAETNEYASLLLAQRLADAKAQKKKAEAEDAKDSQKEKKEKEYQDALAEQAKANAAVEEFQNTAYGAADAVEELKATFLTDNAINTYTDALTKLASTLERVNKIGNLTSMTIAEQMELLEAYPELLSAFEKGALSGAQALKILQKQFDDNKNKLADDLESKRTEWNTGGQAAILKKAGLGGLFNSTESIRSYFDLGKDTFLEKYGKALGDNAETVWNDIEGYIQKQYLFDQLDTRGIGALLEKTITSAAESNYTKAKALVDQASDEMDRSIEDSQEYQDAWNKKLEAYQDIVSSSYQLLDTDETQLKAIFGTDKELEELGINWEEFRKGFDIVNGQVVLNAEVIADWTDKEIALFEQSSGGLESYAEKQQGYYEEIWNAAKEAAQMQIDAAIKAKEAEIEALEERQQAYEDYFDAVDAVEEAESRLDKHDSLVSQIAALTGAIDGSSKSKIKELQSELETLKEEEIAAQKESQRDALLNSINTAIDGLNTAITGLEKSVTELAHSIAAKAIAETPKETEEKQTTNNNQQTEEKPSTDEPQSTMEVEVNITLPQDEAEAAKPKGYAVFVGGGGGGGGKNLMFARWGEETMRFAKGGLVDYTGPAWVDGTPTQPEAFLSATDTRLIQDLVSFLKLDSLPEGGSDVTIEKIEIHTDQLNSDQDFASAGYSLGEAFNNAIRTRGINTNARK